MLTVVAWSGISHVQTLWQPITWTVPCYLPALRRTRLSALYSFVPVAVVTWCTGIGGILLLPQPQTLYHVCDNWAKVIPVPDAAAECRCATWQRRRCVANCSGFNRTGRTVLFIGLNCWYLFLCVVYINIGFLIKSLKISYKISYQVY